MRRTRRPELSAGSMNSCADSAAAMRLCPVLVVAAGPAAQRVDKDRQEDDDDDEIDDRQKCAVAHVGAIAVLAIDEAGDGVRRTTRATSGDIDDNVGDLQLEDDADQDGSYRDR